MNYIIDVLIDNRPEFRLNKHYKASDDLRNILDSNLVFCFDLPDFKQEVYYLTKEYFKFKEKFSHTRPMTNREYVEYRIKKDIAAEKYLNAWIFSNSTIKKAP